MAGHGCLLRIEDPTRDPPQVQNYLVEPGFLKRSDAKLAVCLRAMSEGVGNFLRGLIPVDTQAPVSAEKTETQKISLHIQAPAAKKKQKHRQKEKQEITLEMRRDANETVWPQLLAAYRAIDPHISPTFFYQIEHRNNISKGSKYIFFWLQLNSF